MFYFIIGTNYKYGQLSLYVYKGCRIIVVLNWSMLSDYF